MPTSSSDRTLAMTIAETNMAYQAMHEYRATGPGRPSNFISSATLHEQTRRRLAVASAWLVPLDLATLDGRGAAREAISGLRNRWESRRCRAARRLMRRLAAAVRSTRLGAN